MIPPFDPLVCAYCRADLDPEDFGQRGDGPALQDPDTGKSYCDDRCLRQAPESQERQLLEREPNETDSLNAGCALLAMMVLLFWLIAVPLLLIFT
tara:strand:+ start:94 stop:378 length:285 start_codon:yes stop_codon:yes gene_type:complete